ncbi:uncharacterized protein LOC112591534 [Rhizophagus clarus]|uniref:Uncharacterized protein LOC112591534 n=1 Tax=Rhizophagus clarus TaxID=94130 RepID=A0A8H3LRP7_9GLOM|nr:uncharacterized protein LOC112591534 [Rhizophagus clarus]
MNNLICETISSTRNKDKINIHGYIMLKDKNRKNLYYWRCEKYKTLSCYGCATTLLIEDQHYLKKALDHNHAAEASRAVIQEIVANSSQEIYLYLPSHDALRQSIKRICHINIPTEPQSLESFNISENMKKTLDGSNFLIRDSTIGYDRILIFITVENLKQLEISSFWIMDGTFKTVPIIFNQLYTIHGCVENENSCIMPLIYTLMSSKSEECYRRMFQNLIEYSEEQNIDLQPQFILTDFEKAIINATQAEFQNMQNKGCHFHLVQNVYRKVQHSGLATHYGTNEEFMEANEIMDWFENYYVHGIVQRRLRRSGNIVRHLPLFPPSLWSVTDNIEHAFPRTQNPVEAWHRRWKILVGNSYIGVFKIIKEIQKEQNQIKMNIESILRSIPRPLQKKKDRECEIRI